MLKHWEKLESEPRGDYRVFRVRADLAASPETGESHTFHIVEAADWVNVIPVTPEGKIICIRQYRHGTEHITLEIPGGVIDDGELPADAARREMLEETGYDADEIVLLGSVEPNPAIQNNRCYSYLALNARAVGRQSLDAAEDIEVVLVDPADVPRHILRGEMRHGLVVAAFYLFEQFAGAKHE
jgi:8-oxo-dGTP pyrophosphatase MutT (NUDIX family)